ncbi:MAG: TetR/AcrR family transcriptional regulator [Proteobacteria bacterium]|nr:TetR/AcrR family transcriptional regulator [Pseudomonadota bacterium]
MPTTLTKETARTAVSNRSEEVLEALEKLILAEGFSRLNVSDIAARLSCSKRTLYELAPSKNELVLNVLDGFFRRIRHQAARATDAKMGPERQVLEYLQVGVVAAERLSAAALADIHRWEPARLIWQEHVRLRVEGLRRIIENGVKEGVFRDVRPAFVAEIVFASINRLREPDFYLSTDLTISEAFHELYGMLLKSLTHQPGNSA